MKTPKTTRFWGFSRLFVVLGVVALAMDSVRLAVALTVSDPARVMDAVPCCAIISPRTNKIAGIPLPAK